MNTKLTLSVFVSCLILALSNLLLVVYFVNQREQVESLRNLLIKVEARSEQLQIDHNALLEKVNAHPDFKPYIVPTGKVGDK